ncbi:copper resistance CopC family protein [Glycomyces tenuis]|uniref:copper resistance CopC family protein n=1 Tax=Glycomyces tenuis TaxID=58116 RepID=UPI0003FBBB9F|nr:copper resistance CopC family protein [Glycomyces tenuis]
MLQGSRAHALRLLLAAGCGAVLAAATATAASAHAALLGTDPEDGATLDTAPASVSATFSEVLDGPSTTIAVTDPAGETLELDEAAFEGDTFTQPMLYTTPGEYTVAFRVVSEDGHRVDDAWTFTVEAIPDELLAEGAESTDSAAPTETETEAEAETSEAAEPDTSDAADSPEEDTNTGTTLALILLAALVVVVGGVLLVKLLGRGSKDDGSADRSA